MNHASSEMKFFLYEQDMLRYLNRECYTSLNEWLQQSCSVYAKRVAFTSEGRELTFGELDELSLALASYFHFVCGLNKGDRVAIRLPNIWQYPVVAWAALRAGLVIVNTDPLYSAPELRHQLIDSGARMVVTQEGATDSLGRILPETEVEQLLLIPNLSGSAERPVLAGQRIAPAVSFESAVRSGEGWKLPDFHLTMNDLALVQYTGGTTGFPRGVMLTHGNVFSSVMQSAEFSEIDPDRPDLVICPIPIHHIYAFTLNVISICCRGGHSVLIPQAGDTESLIGAMKAYPFTLLVGVNAVFATLLNHPDFDQADFSRVVGIISGGSALREDIVSEWFKRSGTHIYEGYGLSETTGTVSCNTPLARRPGTVGRAYRSTQIKLVPVDGQQAAAHHGEVWVRGPQVMHGYWNPSAEPALALDHAGWFRTGDIGALDEDGFLQLFDRLQDVIKVSGMDVYPSEVESVVSRHPGILECAVVGVPDAPAGEVVKLFVTARDKNLTPQAITQFCRERLVAHKVPVHIEFLSSLPKSSVGKLLRRELGSN